MASLTVLNPGLLATVQDLGRAGHATIGLPIGGAADPLSLRIGNTIVGNSPTAAAIEMTLLGATIDFHTATTIALVGGHATATLHQRPIELARPIEVHPGDRLRIGPITRGVRTYLCMRGGLDLPNILGSQSTCLPASFGGHDGRPLRAGDEIKLGSETPAAPRAPSASILALLDDLLSPLSLRALEGAQASSFPAAALDRFWSAPFIISQHSDRIGIRLEGSIGDAGAGRMPSEGMMCGAVQVPPGGAPIILSVDHPTTGGYPVIASIAAIDLPLLGQLRPGDRIRFHRITQHEALTAFHEREQLLRAWETGP